MRNDFLPFSKPSISEEDIAAVADVLRSGWITTGPKVAQFEEDFKKYTSCGEAVSMTSETSVMHALLRALNIGPGDEVITPSMTWVSLPNTVLLFGATPVFVDVDRDTLMVTPEAIEEKITPRTRLIVPVHFAGAALNMGPIRKITEKHNIMLVEDAAHALGSEWNGERIGAKGTCMFSFHPIKNAWHLFVVSVTDKAGLTRDEFMSELKKRNIGTGLHFRCTHLQKYYRDVLVYQTGMYPNTEWNSERICSIPLFPDMTEKDQDDVIEAIKDILAKR